MIELNYKQNYQGPSTTAKSAVDGRLKVGVASLKKAIKNKKIKKMNKEDKSKSLMTPKPEIMGVKPYGSIGPDRSQSETKVVEKIKGKKKAKLGIGSTSKSGEKANVGGISKVIGNFINRK